MLLTISSASVTASLLFAHMGAPIAVGTCNWADHTDFYPDELEHGRRQRDKLTYYAEFFPIVEIDTTFYGIPRPQVVEGWVERTPEDFRFNIKAYRSLTGHEREDRIPRKPTVEEERDFMAALDAAALQRQAGRRPLPVPAMVDQPPGGSRVAAGRA